MEPHRPTTAALLESSASWHIHAITADTTFPERIAQAVGIAIGSVATSGNTSTAAVSLPIAVAVATA